MSLVDLIFYPFTLVKKIVPKGLFGRSLLILLLPIFCIQLMTTYLFIDRHLSKVTELLANNIASKVSGVVEQVMAEKDVKGQLVHLQSSIWHQYSFNLYYQQHKKSSNITVEDSITTPSPEEILLHQALAFRLNYPFKVWIDREQDYFYVSVDTPKGQFILQDRFKHLYPRTTKIFMWWVILAPIFLIFIAILFLKNQIKPLRFLAEAVDDFGKGRGVSYIKPNGSFEIRKLTQAFNTMAERITRQMTQRTEMLAGISHDLRTPLTRMELQFAMMSSQPEIEDLHEDVREMRRMVEEFLAFTRGEGGEETQECNLGTLIEQLSTKYDSARLQINLPEEAVQLKIRKDAFKRCLTNLINNAMRYAKNLRLTLSQEEGHGCTILFDDDGPGIPYKSREAVFKPFFRLENSRNCETGGVGLGLAITQDIVHSHGGTIRLDESPLGGLRVIVQLP